jgi:hypothetical protein
VLSSHLKIEHGRDPPHRRQGAAAVPTTPMEFAAFIASQTERFGKIRREAGVKAE